MISDQIAVSALQFLGDLMNEYEINCPKKYSPSELVAEINDFFKELEK